MGNAGLMEDCWPFLRFPWYQGRTVLVLQNILAAFDLLLPVRFCLSASGGWGINRRFGVPGFGVFFSRSNGEWQTYGQKPTMAHCLKLERPLAFRSTHIVLEAFRICSTPCLGS